MNLLGFSVSGLVQEVGYEENIFSPGGDSHPNGLNALPSLA